MRLVVMIVVHFGRCVFEFRQRTALNDVYIA